MYTLILLMTCLAYAVQPEDIQPSLVPSSTQDSAADAMRKIRIPAAQWYPQADADDIAVACFCIAVVN